MNKWIAEFDLEDGDTMPEHMDLNYMGGKIDFHCRPMWIPCSERLPKEDTEVIVSCTDDSGDSEFSYTTTGWHFNGVWVVGNDRSYFVRAWMPLPKPWKGDIE